MRRAVLLITLASFAGLAGCTRQSKSQTSASTRKGATTGATTAARAEGLVTAVVQTVTLPDYLQIPAHIEPDPIRVVRVYSPVGGRLIELQVRPGDRVEKGQTLAVVQSGDVSAGLAAYSKAKADLQVKQEEFARSSDLYAHGALAQKDLQQAQADMKMSQADLDNALRQLRILGENPDSGSDQIPVTAPRSGVVLQVSAAAGEFSKSLDSSEPLCVLADLGTVWAVGDLLEKDFSKVKVGDPTELSLVALRGESWKGRVSLISNTVDPATRTLKLRVVLANPGGVLRPEMFGTLRLDRAESTGIVVPDTAVVREGTAAFVFVKRPAGQYIRRPVTLGPEVEGGDVEITSGLHSGDTIVVQGADLLRSALAGP